MNTAIVKVPIEIDTNVRLEEGEYIGCVRFRIANTWHKWEPHEVLIDADSMEEAKAKMEDLKQNIIAEMERTEDEPH